MADKFLAPEPDTKKRRIANSKAKKKRSYPQPKYFVPLNPQKYVGDAKKIVARSNLENRFFKIFDANSAILQWGSEEMHVQYFSNVDHKVHRYFPDVILKLKTRSGETKVYMIEIKPKSQCFPPKKRNSKQYITEAQTYQVNQDKWQAAETWCKKRGMIFWVLTEEHLGGF